jgi:hypothetical protein
MVMGKLSNLPPGVTDRMIEENAGCEKNSDGPTESKADEFRNWPPAEESAPEPALDPKPLAARAANEGVDRDSQCTDSQCAASSQDVSGELNQEEWLDTVYKPALQRAFNGDWTGLAMLAGNLRELNREQELDEKDGDAAQ